jgi:methyltransferase (TIGR00027 family)
MTAYSFQDAAISWDQDFRDRVNPDLMTSLLRTSIPVLEQSDWKVVQVREGYCETLLPLNRATTNQHGTHQAALMSLSADYTGGLALATLLRGVPLAGVHPCREDVSASLWLAGMNVRYKSPSTGHLTGICEISEDQAHDIRKRYFSGSRVLASLDVKFYSNGELTAEAEMKYFAQPTIQLSPAAPKPSRSTLFNHKLKASARMIAGLRARPSSLKRVSIQCPHANVVAGPHGELLASHLNSILPQLQDMVQLRSQHIDELIEAVPGLRQVVLAGAGLDMRSLRHAANLPGVTFFELDLPEMMAERERVTKQLSDDFADRRVLLTADFKCDDLAVLLSQHPRFMPTEPTVIVFEGCSMYFPEPDNRRLFQTFHSLLRHPESCLWADFVDTSVVTRRTNNQRILAFLEGMDSLGESFVFGTDHPGAWLQELGFGQVQTISSGDYLGDPDAVLSLYSFAVARP